MSLLGLVTIALLYSTFLAISVPSVLAQSFENRYPVVALSSTNSSTQNIPQYTVASIPTVTSVFSTIISSGDTKVIILPGINTRYETTYSSATTLDQTITALSGAHPYTHPLPHTDTFTFVASGSGPQGFGYPLGSTIATITLEGPTTYSTTAVAGFANVFGPWTFPTSTNTHCLGTGLISQPGHYYTIAELSTVVTNAGWNVSSISRTVTQLLKPIYDYGAKGFAPGIQCSGICGFCNIYFPTVEVYYWPPPGGVITTCLGNDTLPIATLPSSGVRGMVVRPRQISSSANISTLVNSNGFTFTSPSVYVAFAEISATDGCGLVGSVYTQTTLGFAPGELSTAVINASAAAYGMTPQYFPFDFKYAVCPPASLESMDHISFVGQQGYKPIISPPAAITNLDPTWSSALCHAALFQGNDPPIALQPAANLYPHTTSIAPVPVSTPPTPADPSIPAVPSATTLPGWLSVPALHSFPVLASSTKPASAGPTPGNPLSVIGFSTSPASATTAVGNPVPASPNPDPIASIPLNPAPANPVLTKAGHAVAASATLVSADLAPLSKPSSFTGTIAPPFAAPKDNTPIPQLPSIGSSAIPNNPGDDSSSGNNDLSNAVVQPAAIVVNGVTSTLQTASATTVRPPAGQSPPAPAAILNFGSSTITADPNSHFIIGSQTLAAGSAVTVAGTPISLVPLGGIAVLGGSTQVLGIVTATHGPPVLTFGGQSITANPSSAFIISSQTLTPGGSVTVSGTPISFHPTESIVFIGSSTQTLNPAVPRTPAVLSFARSSITANSLGNFVLGTQTLTPGGAITVSGTPISLHSTDNVVLIGSISHTLNVAMPIGPTAPAVLSVGGNSVTVNSLGDFILGRQTLTPGGAITLSGTPISLALTGNIAIIGSITQILHPSSSTAPLVLSFAGSSITANSLGAFVIGTQTLTPGGVITVSGTTLSLPSPSHSAASLSVKGAFTLGGTTYTENSLSLLIIGSQTLSPGGVITVSGTPLSFATGAGTRGVVVGGSTQLLGTFITSGINGGPKSTGQGVQIYGGGAPRIGRSTKWLLRAFVMQTAFLLWV